MVRTLSIILGYGAMYALFAALGPTFEVAPGVGLWAPLAGLNLVLAILLGWVSLPAILLATVAGSMFMRDPALSVEQAVPLALIVALGYSAAGAWVRRKRATTSSISAVRFIQPVAAAGLVLPMAINLLSVATLTFMGLEGYAWATYAPTVVARWLGDVVGILTLAPLLLVMIEPYQPAWGTKAASGKGLLPARQRAPIIEFALELGGIVLAIYFAFFLPDADSFQYYVCLLPLLAIAWQHGLLRAILAVFLLNVGIVLALSMQEAPPWREIQLFMIVLALLGLFLGALMAHSRQRLTALREAHQAALEKIEEYTVALDGARSNLEAQVRQRKEVEETLQTSVDDLATKTQEQAQLNDKLRTSEQALQELNARKDKLFSIVSHDVRNMLVSAIGFSKLLISDIDTLPRDMVKEFASHVHSSTTNTYDLLENLLTWARMQTGRMYYQRAWHGIHDIVQNNITMLHNNAAQKDITLEKKTDRDAQVYADRNMINSVLQNLITNAIKFTERGGTITIASRSYDNTVEISVADTGVGIKPEDAEKLFRIDQHHSSEGTEEEHGTGLGLVLCKEMIEKHDGRIWVESEPGKGSTFCFTLPCVPEAPEEFTLDFTEEQVAEEA